MVTLFPLQTFHGIKIRTVPDVWRQRRTWKERLFTRPWQPLLKEKLVVNPNCPPDGQFIVLEHDFMLCNERTYRELERVTIARSVRNDTAV